jgi:hypothetical protein
MDAVICIPSRRVFDVSIVVSCSRVKIMEKGFILLIKECRKEIKTHLEKKSQVCERINLQQNTETTYLYALRKKDTMIM